MVTPEDKPKYVVVLDDDAAVSLIIAKVLSLECRHFDTKAKLMAESDPRQPVAAFIDIHLGVDISGLDIIPDLKKRWPSCPIVVITADPTDEAVSRALSAGADDFIQKPIRPKELIARLQTRLGDLAQREAKNSVAYGDIALDLLNRQLRGPRGSRYLSPMELKLFLCLLNAQGTIVSKERLKRQAWHDITVSENALDRKIFELRRALKDVSESVVLKAVYGVGLTLRLKDAADSSTGPDSGGQAKASGE